MTKIILFFIFMFSVFSANAEMTRRHLELELEQVDGAGGYEVQVTKILSNGTRKKPFVFKLKNNLWAANLNPGNYELRVRSVDERGVPGLWSDPEKILVKLISPNIIFPSRDARVQGDDDKSDDVKFEWEKVDGAEKYVFKLYDSSGKQILSKNIDDTYFKTELKVGQGYSWEVTPLFEEKLEGETTPRASFSFLGPKLDEPQEVRIEDINTNLIQWKAPKFASKYDFVLEKKDEKGDWVFFDKKESTQPEVKYVQPLNSGEYRIKVTALADYRGNSDPMYQEFKTQLYSNRSPAAIEQIKSEQSYDTKSRFFALASYYISIISYRGQIADTNTDSSYFAVGGTGRLGAGMWFKEDGPWGAIVTADMSGFTVANITKTYLSGYGGAAYRLRLGALGQLRATLGASYRELPVTVPSSAQPPVEYTQTKVSSLGPSAAVSIAHGISRKLGFQINASVTQAMVDMGTPNGHGQIPTTSFQYGLLGSLKLSDSLVGFMGYAYKDEAASYQSTISGQSNNISITGHYLNLMLEYGL